MNIWPPPPKRPEPETMQASQSRSASKPLVSVALGLLSGLLGGAAVSVIVWLAKCALGWHSSYFASHGYLYFLAIPIEIGLGYAMLPKNKIFAFSFAIIAVCVSVVLAAICIFLDGFPELD